MNQEFGDTRPWGRYEVLLEEETYKVKRIIVKPKQRLSLQYHNKRSEVWIIVQGTALVTCGDKEIKSIKGEYISIPRQTKHRIENIGSDEVIFIEVQNGSYLGEDDIVRIEDDYNRRIN